MGSSGSDMFHHLDFLTKAETYRRIFIKTLNDEYAFGDLKQVREVGKLQMSFLDQLKILNMNYLLSFLYFLSI